LLWVRYFIHISFDLSQISDIKTSLTTILKEIKNLDLVFLNAGMLGKIKILKELSIEEMQEVYSLNVYANNSL